MNATSDLNRIAFVGDLHGKHSAFEHTLDLAVSAGATTIIQTGDFGFHHPADLDLLQLLLDERAPDADYRIIDGNHEDFTLLNPDTTEPTPLTRSITHMPRGSRTTIAGINMLFLGGATSTDRQWRTEGVDWFPAEHITDAQVDRAITASGTGAGTDPVDILVTHETGTTAFTALAADSEHARDKVGDPLGDADRARIDRVLSAVHPTVHIHGHHHTRFAAPLDGEPTGTLDIALAKETDDGSVVVLDTHAGGPDQWTWPVPVAHRQVITDTGWYPVDEFTVTGSGPLWPWADFELPWPTPAFTADTPAATVESVTAHRMTLQQFLGRGGGGTHRLPRTWWMCFDADKAVEGHPQWAGPAERFTHWLTTEDLTALATHLLDPAPQCDVYRALSTMPLRWGTAEIRLWAADAAKQHHR
jgi:predicted phosphodiesterase